MFRKSFLLQNCFFVAKRSISTKNARKFPKILITGGLGQLGTGLAKKLRNLYGAENVIMSDIIKVPEEQKNEGPYIFADVMDFQGLQEIIVNHEIGRVIHLSALLSAVGENNVPLAMKINIKGVQNVMELARQYRLKLFIPSTIGAFGPDSPRERTPDICIQRPRTIYGVAKVHTELLGEYYYQKFGLDFRCLRLPGVISPSTNPGGGTTDYAVHIFHEAVAKGEFECFLQPDTRLPMIYIDDCLKGIIKFLEVPDDALTLRTYNLAAIDFTPEELVETLRRYIPKLRVTYQSDYRQDIADSWPQVLDDSTARRDWGWNHEYDIHRTCRSMLVKILKNRPHSFFVDHETLKADLSKDSPHSDSERIFSRNNYPDYISSGEKRYFT